MEAQPPEETSTFQKSFGLIEHVDAQTVNLDRCVVGYVQAKENAMVDNNLTNAIVAGRYITAADNLSTTVVAGNNMNMENCLTAVSVVGNTLNLQESKSAFTVSKQANVTGGKVGILLASKAFLSENTTVTLGTPQAAAMGAAAGAVFALLGWLLRRRR